MHITASVFINDDEKGLHHDFETWLEHLVALVISNMTASTHHQARIAGHRERRIASLYAMSRELAATRGEGNLLRIAVKHVAEVFEAQVVVLLPDETGRLAYPKDEGTVQSCHGSDLSVAQWVYDHEHMA